jgi:hypothetical protein
MTRGRRTALVVLGVLLALAGLVAAYVKVELAEPEAFADRGVVALQSEPVRTVIGQQVAVQLLERQSPDLIATRPLVVTAVEAILETDSFARVLRQTALTAHGVLIRGDSDVSVELAEVRGVLLPALRSVSPELARRVPDDLRPQIAEIRSSDAATFTVRTAESASVAAVPLLVAAVLALLGAVMWAPDRRGAIGTAGLSLAGGMGAGLIALAALRAQIVSGSAGVGVVTQDDARAAAGAGWAALAGDLQRLLVVTGLGGVAVWVAAELGELRLDRAALARRAAEVVAGGRLPVAARLLRGVALAGLGGLVLLGIDPVATGVAGGVGAVLLLLGLAEALSVARTAPARVAARRRSSPSRRGRVGLGAAVLAAAGAALAVALSGGPPAPLDRDEVVRCNGLTALCDRRLDQVVLPGPTTRCRPPTARAGCWPTSRGRSRASSRTASACCSSTPTTGSSTARGASAPTSRPRARPATAPRPSWARTPCAPRSAWQAASVSSLSTGSARSTCATRSASWARSGSPRRCARSAAGWSATARRCSSCCSSRASSPRTSRRPSGRPSSSATWPRSSAGARSRRCAR